jgi:hypothetical protein
LADSMLSLQNKKLAINWWFLWSYPVRTHFYWFDKFSGPKMPLIRLKISKHFASWQLNKNELEGFLWSPKSKPMLEWSNTVYWDICRSYNHILCKRIELHISAALNWAIEHIECTTSAQLSAENQCCKYWVQLIWGSKELSAANC